MGLYIDMEMPKDCIKCNFCLFSDGNWKCLVDGSNADFGGTCRPYLCHLIPVPSHGELIERDALLKKCEYVCTDDDVDILAVRYSIIENAPTIIPAEEPSVMPTAEV